MIQHVNAIFEHGVLRPLTPINFQDQEMVALSIEKIGADGSGCNQTGRTLLEILDGAGLVGCIPDAPSDLSTNPRHMEGFGTSGS